MEQRLLDVFFYGLFMDYELLRDRGFRPTEIRVAVVQDFALRIGARAALAPAPNGQVHGLLMKLPAADLERLYSEPSVQAYRPEPVRAMTADGAIVTARCYNLPQPPAPDERNPEYAAKLRDVARRVGLPSDYVSSIQ